MNLSVHTLFFSPSGGTQKAAFCSPMHFLLRFSHIASSSPSLHFPLTTWSLSHFLFSPEESLPMHGKS